MSSNEKNGGTAAKKSFFQLIKFGLVGIGNTLIDMVISTVLSIVLAIPFTAVGQFMFQKLSAIAPAF